MPNGVDVYRALVRRLYPTGPEFPVLPTGIATGGSATTLIDTVNLSYTSGNANALDGIWVLDETGYNYSRVTRGQWDTANSTLTFADILTDFAAGDRYALSEHHPVFLRNAVNDVLSSLYVDSFAPLSSHVVTNDENDMETSPHTTFYANRTGSGTTLAEETSIVFNGAKSLKITATTGTAQYTHPGAYSVTESKSYYVSVMCYVTQGDSAELSIYDVTNAAEIDDATTDEPNWTELAMLFTPPSGCEQVQARMTSVANTDVTYWDDYIMVDTSQTRFRCPSWITSEAQIMDVVELPRGSGGPASDNDYRTLEKAAHSVNWRPAFKDWRATNELFIEVDPFATRRYILAKRPLAEINDWSTSGLSGGGTSTSGSTTTLVNSGGLMAGSPVIEVGQLEGFTITCTSGTGGGQEATIITNTATSATIEGTWTAPGADTVYTIQANRTEPFPINEIVKHCVYIIENKDEREGYLAALRQASLGGARIYAPSRVYSR